MNWASARWASAGKPLCWASKFARPIGCRRHFSSASATCAGPIGDRGWSWIPKAGSSSGFTEMISLSAPLTEEKIRGLKVGDEVGLTGVVFTGRDAVHKFLHDGGLLPAEGN